jgi:hypothetical protein|tara:strand:+ start:798 stop:1130 length:333 start_codon:yes stop_codon:yes gene_type:complete
MIEGNVTSTEILGILYKGEAGDIILLNDTGAHTVVIEHRDDAGLPQKMNDMLFVTSHEVAWENGTVEIWASDLWEDLVADTQEDDGDEAALKLTGYIQSTFQSVILTTDI